ncbi:MAG: peroxiredoxin family protein [Bacteroidales bacterium]
MTKIFYTTVFLWIALTFQGSAQVHNITITIHLRGVYDSKISLLALSAAGTFKPISELQGIKDGETTIVSVSENYLPGEFVLRFDYKEKESGTPYPSEKYLFIGDQNLELWMSPKYCNNADSSYFQKDEKENAAFVVFSKENGRQKEKLGLLQNFLMNYDDNNSTFYQEGIKEYELRRITYNQWLKNRVVKDKALFVSNLYLFQYLPQISFQGRESDRIQSLITHYFDGMDFTDPLVIKTAEMNKWIDGYVNLYGQSATTIALRDSLFPAAGKTAIEKARQGNPRVYGWMVDYFYRGYETNGITAGMKILEPYLNDSTCLTSKRQEISRRLKGMATLFTGSIAPDIGLKDNDNNPFELYKTETQCKYILILFWSAGCSHCMETVNALYPRQQQTDIQQKLRVVAISLDETETEIKSYNEKIKELKGWLHLHAAEGVRSKVAADYYVLATPVMVLLDAKTKKIVGVPDTLNELIAALRD